jgi:FAD/FMN-containing dehydrogenase
MPDSISSSLVADMDVFSPELVRPIRPLSPALIERFAAIVGDKHAVTDEADLAPYLVEDRGLYQGRSALVLRPGTTAEVAAICRIAHETETAIVPQGGNTGLVGGQTAHHGEIILSLRRLGTIREIDVTSNTLTCEAGVVLATAQAAAADMDRLFPLSLGAEGSCTIGGNLATNAGGTAAVRYGTARDLCLGLEVVLPDGSIFNGMSKLKKDNTGYDLRDLFIGSEGTLGIITAAVLKLFPKPRSIQTAMVGLASPRAALDLLKLVQAMIGSSLTSFELIARICLEFVVRHGPGIRLPMSDTHPWYVLIELSSMSGSEDDAMEAVLASAIEHKLIGDAVMASSDTQRRQLWSIREMISEVQKHEGGSIKHDISVPISAIPDFIDAANAEVTRLIPGARPVIFGHLGDGNLHYNVSQPSGSDFGAAKERILSRWYDVQHRVHATVGKFSGSISAEHGVGVMKRDELDQVKDPVAMRLMRSLKDAIDPLNILNPGKVV